jgi:Flp pilus assembly protein TadD
MYDDRGFATFDQSERPDEYAVIRFHLSRALRSLLILSCAFGVAACQSINGEFQGNAFGDRNAGVIDFPEANFYSSDEAVQKGQNYFRNGDYGKAVASYRRAVELLPNDADAWLGLAASLDFVRRFDLADNAYAQYARLDGKNLEYYNNLGYSYLLRGELPVARGNFLKAYELDPSNAVVAGNLQLLRNSINVPQR